MQIASRALKHLSLALTLGLTLLAGSTSLDAADIILDNASSSGVTITGSWLPSTSQSGYYGSNYIHDGNSGKGTKSVRFTPSIPSAGEYEVFMRWTSDQNRPSVVPVTITSQDGATQTTVNQQQNGSKWNSLGIFTMAAGTSGNLLVETTGTAGKHVIVDAVMFSPATPFETVVDNTSANATVTGAWSSSTSTSGFYGSNYIYDQSTGKGSKWVKYTPDLPQHGFYEVFLRWTPGTNRADNVPVMVRTATEDFEIEINQKKEGRPWVSIGKFPFNSDAGEFVMISNAGTAEGAAVIADAVRFVHVPTSETIIDNGDAGAIITGQWTSASTTPGGYNGGYLHDNNENKGGKSVQYTPTITSTGLYEVFARWTHGSNRPENAPYEVSSADGAETLLADQTEGGAQWNSLGTYTFTAGTSGNVLLSNTGTAAGTYVIADAIKIARRPDVEIIVDNLDTAAISSTGSWASSTHTSGFYGTDYSHDSNQNIGQKTFRFAPSLPESGNYEVFMQWPASGSRHDAVPVTIAWAGGVSQTTVNQKQNGNQWNSIGNYNFIAGTSGYVEISNAGAGSGETVVADAVKFVRKAALWTPEDLGDKLWIYWSADDLPNGSVTDWFDRVRAHDPAQKSQTRASSWYGEEASESDPHAEPVKQNGEVFFGPSNDRRLLFPKQELSYSAHKGVMMLFRVDLSGSHQDGMMFSVNGATSTGTRQPSISYKPSANQIGVTWKTEQTGSNSGYNGIALNMPVDKTKWHCVVSRRTPDWHFASLDGKKSDGITSGESSVEMLYHGLPRNNYEDSEEANSPDIQVRGFIGNTNANAAPEMAFDSIIITQGEELTEDEAQKLMGWAMWKKGAQAQLPASHPYRYHPPYKALPASYQFVESTPSEYAAVKAFWENTNLSEAYMGTPVNTSGWSLVFEDQFTKHSVTDEDRGEGDWFGPVHPHITGEAKAVFPGITPGDLTTGTPGNPATYVHDPVADTMTIQMQKYNGAWRSGAFCSMNISGHGRSWMYPYVEVRMKAGPSDTGNWYGSWPAVWLLSKNFLTNRAESYLEYDIYEGYSVDPEGYHNAYHNHDAVLVKPGRLANDRYVSNYVGLDNPNNWHEYVNLFDNQFHTYGAMVTPEWVYTYFDGKEISRFPTPVEMKQPLWLLIDLAMENGFADDADGIYELEVDYVRVYQNPAYSQ